MAISQKTANKSTTPAIQLPLFVTNKNKWIVAFATALPAAFFYMWANHSPILPPKVLPLTFVDHWVPFIQNSVWIYVSEYLFFFICIHFCRNTENLSRFFYAFVGLQSFSVLVFFAYPTVFPRELFPIVGDGLTADVFRYLRSIDAPTNCFPSLHVASCYLMALVYLHESRKGFWIFFAWASLVALSTMTTKQHFAVDVLAGGILAFLFYWLAFRLSKNN